LDKKFKITGAVFDLDGTLLDSMSIWTDLGEAYLRTKGITAEENLSEKLKAMSLNQSAGYFIEKYGIKDSVQEIIDDINKMIEDFYLYHVQLKEGVSEFLEYLNGKNVKMCIATATDKKLAEGALKRCGMLDFFEYIFTCEEVRYGKDCPEIFNKALDFLNTEKEFTWVFEDAVYAAMTARDAGFNVCVVYDKSESETEKLKEISEIYIKSFMEAGDYFD